MSDTISEERLAELRATAERLSDRPNGFRAVKVDAADLLALLARLDAAERAATPRPPQDATAGPWLLWYWKDGSLAGVGRRHRDAVLFEVGRIDLGYSELWGWLPLPAPTPAAGTEHPHPFPPVDEAGRAYWEKRDREHYGDRPH